MATMSGEHDPALNPTVDAASDGPARGRTTVGAAPTTPISPASTLPPPEPGLASGARLGRYVVSGLIGAGGMGEVHAAYDPELDRKVAIKLLHRDLGAQAGDRLRREARTMARLSHRNLVAVHDVGEHEGRLFLAMELLEGTTLRGWARARPWREVLRAYLDAGRGLAAAHDAGVVHRDFKPDNVLLGKDGRVAVTDFGIARRRDVAGADDDPAASGRIPDVELTHTGAMIGTPLYMAPEQLDGESADARSDQFAFAVALWEALYGSHPLVPRGSELEALRAAMRGGDALTAPARPAPARVGRALVRALRPDPAARWPSLAALLEQLDVSRPRTLRLALFAGGAVAIAGITAGVAFGTAARSAPVDVCGGGDALLGQVWNPARQQALRAEFLATKLPFAAAAWDNARLATERWGASWGASRLRTCRASAVFREEPAATNADRMRCFARQLVELDAQLTQLRRPSVDQVSRAAAAITGLGEPDRCERVNAAILADPALDRGRQALADGSERVSAEASAALGVGRYRVAAPLATIAATLADAAGVVRLRHHPRDILGRVLGQLGDSKRALVELQRANQLADEAGDDDARAQALSAMATNAYMGEDYPGALEYIEQGMAASRRQGAPPVMTARLLGVRCQVQHELQQEDAALASIQEAIRLLEDPAIQRDSLLAGHYARMAPVLWALRRYEETDAAYQRAIALSEQADGADHPLLATLLVNYAAYLNKMKRYDEAEALLLRAQRIRVAVYGPDHPTVATILQNLGSGYRAAGKLEEAEVAFRKALAVYQTSPDFAYALPSANTGLGNLLATRHRYGDAVPYFEAALQGFIDHKASAENIADLRFRLGRALWHSGRDQARGMALAGEARDFYVKVGDMPLTLADVEGWMRDPEHVVFKEFR